MLGRKSLSTGQVAAVLAVVALIGGCREATTGPLDPNSSAFASSINLISGNLQTGQIGVPLSQVLTVKVIDAGGLPVQGASVTFVVRSGGGSILAPSSVSDANGQVTAAWTLGATLGTQTAVAVLASNFVNDSTQFTATATPGPAGTIVIVSGNNQLSLAGKALALPLVVKVADAYGNNISGARVTWTAASSSGSPAIPSDTTAADGTASTTWIAGTSATVQTMSATVTGLTAVSFQAVVSPDTSRKITILAPNPLVPVTASAGATLAQLSVRVTDQFLNPIAGDLVTWTDQVIGGGSVSAPTTTTDATGMASTVWTLGAHTGPQTLRVKEGSLGVTQTFTATATVAFSTVIAANFSACGVSAADDRIYCWGANDAGQLGKGTATNTTAPTTAVASSADSSSEAPYVVARQISGQRSSTCALTISQQIYCWGRVVGGVATSTTASLVTINFGGSGAPFAANFIAVGDDHECFYNLAGRTDCTGVNSEGQVGNGTMAAVPPSEWDPVLGPNFSYVTTGSSHTCAMPRYNPADPASQVPLCWGYNANGQLGIGTLADSPTPTAVTMPAGVTAFDSLSLSAGVAHTCAMTTTGLGYCWGSNSFGQLGKGGSVSAASRDSVPQAVQMPSGVTFGSMYAGKYHTCAIEAAGSSSPGSAWCWGRDDYGQLGDGAQAPFGTGITAPVQVTGGLRFRSLSLGELYTCGVVAPLGSATGPSASAGTIYCWGDNVFGQIGNGQASGGNTPVLNPLAGRVLFQP